MPSRSALSGSIKKNFVSIFEKKRNPVISQLLRHQPRSLCITKVIPIDEGQDELIKDIKSHATTIVREKKKKSRLPGMKLLKSYNLQHYSENRKSMDSKIAKTAEAPEALTEEQQQDEDYEALKNFEEKKITKKPRKTQVGGGTITSSAEDIMALLSELVKWITTAFCRGRSKSMTRRQASETKHSIRQSLWNSIKDTVPPLLREDQKSFSEQVAERLAEVLLLIDETKNGSTDMSGVISKGLNNLLARFFSGKVQRGDELTKALRAFSNRAMRAFRCD